MIEGTTESGFEFEIDDDVLDDYELLEALCQIDEGDTSKTIKMVDMLLGEEQKEKLKEHVRAGGKRVSAKKLISEVMGIFNAIKEGKNS